MNDVHSDVMAVAEDLPVAEQLFVRVLRELGEAYGDHVFYVERDLVYAVQRQLQELIDAESGPWRLYNDYPMLPGPRRSFSADLALVDSAGEVVVAAEFKYEPCHSRPDVLRNKLPVTVWSDIVKDTARTREFVDRGKAEVGYAVVIDEGGHLAKRDLAVYSDRQVWTGHPGHDHHVDALIFRYSSGRPFGDELKGV